MRPNRPIRVGLFGASSLGRSCLEQLRRHYREALAACFFDNDQRKWNSSVDGVPVKEPSKAELAAVDVIWLTTTYADDVQAQLKALEIATRQAYTLPEVLGRTAPAGPSSTALRDDGSGPRVNIVMADEGWILERCVREIEKRLPYVRASRCADPAAAINYYVNYAAYRGGVGGHQAAFFTHVEERAAGMPERFFRVAGAMDAVVAMSERYARQLREAGIENVHLITPGIDLDRFQPRVKIGVVGRTYQTGRKGEDMVRAVFDEPGIEWHFTGSGWPGEPRMHSDEEMPGFYRSIDYLLVPAYYEGGPMPVLEALASGIEVIAPRVGFADEYPHIEYAVGSADDLRRVLRGLVAQRLERRRSVETRTWDAWAAAHDHLFKAMVQTPSRVARGSVSEPPVDFAGRRLRVLFALHAPESVSPIGGPSIRLPHTQRALAEHGVDVDISREELPDPRGYDLVHVFNISERKAALGQLKHLRTFDTPIVFSPICLKVQEGVWAQRAVLPVFQQDLSDSDFRAALARLASTPMDVREAIGMAVDEHWGARIREITALADHLIMLSEVEISALADIGAITSSFSLVHNGVDPAWAEGATGDLFREKFGLSDYVLCVGRLEPRKNQLMLARALRDTNIDLVLIGAAQQPEYAELVRRHGGRVHFVPKLTHDDPLFRSALAGARAFVLVSWSEGASLAVLEAASFGLPLVLSDRSSEREYFGPLARYCDPLDLDGLRQHVTEAFAEPLDSPLRQARRDLINRALTWAHTARETAHAYAKVLKERRPDRPLPGGFMPPPPRRLEIGSGMTPQKGYEHLDARPDLPDIDHVADIRHTLPFPTGTFDEVMSRSCIEHVSWREVRGVLTEWGRILKPGGTLDVWTPDFEYLCRQYLARKDDGHLEPALAEEARRALGGYDAQAWAIIKMFGGQDYPENFHGTVMDEEVLTRVLEASGFGRVQRQEPFTGLRLKARRMPAFQHRPSSGETATDVPGTWSAPEAPGLIWEGPAFEAGAHGALTRQILRAIIPAGVAVQLVSGDDERQRKAFIDSPAEGWLWKRALRRQFNGHVHLSCGSAVCDSRSTRTNEHLGMRAHAALCVNEADRLHLSQPESLDALDEVWVSSHYDRDLFVRAGAAAEKIQVVPLGVDPSRYDPAAVTPLDIPGRRGFVFLSSFDDDEHDGWELLLGAYTRAFAARDDVTLVLQTNTRESAAALKDRVETFVAGLGSRSQQPLVIVLTEPVGDDHMPTLYRAADALVVPIAASTTALTMLEAMASALAVVAPPQGAHMDFADAASVWLVDDARSGSPVDGLAATLRRIVADPGAARRSGIAAREHVRTTWTATRTTSWIANRLTHLIPDSRIPMELGRRAEATGQLDAAAQHYAHAAEVKPDWLTPVYNRASVLKRQGRGAEAAELFERIARDGDTPELRGGAAYHLGELAMGQGRLVVASDAFEACRAELPHHRRARAWLALIRGRLEEQAERFEPARQAYREALSIDGTWSVAAYSLASTLKRLGETDKAASLFANLLATADQAGLRGGAHFHLAELHVRSHRTEEAIGHLESCLLEIPTHQAAARLLESLRVTAPALASTRR